MIGTILLTLDAAANLVLPASERHGLCERVTRDDGKNLVVQYVGGKDAKYVSTDSGDYSYWRLTGKLTQTRKRDSFTACNSEFTLTIPLRLVYGLSRSEPTDELPGTLVELVSALRATSSTLKTALQANLVTIDVGSIDTQRDSVVNTELPGFVLPMQLTMCAVDITLSIVADRDCLVNCEEQTPVIPVPLVRPCPVLRMCGPFVSGNVPTWNGTAWVPQTPSSGGGGVTPIQGFTDNNGVAVFDVSGITTPYLISFYGLGAACDFVDFDTTFPNPATTSMTFKNNGSPLVQESVVIVLTSYTQ